MRISSALTPRQRRALSFVCLLAPLLRHAPYSGWLSALLVLAPLAALGWLLGQGPVRLPRALAGAWGVWLVFYGGFVLRSGAERFVSAVYTDSPLWPFVLSAGALGLLAAAGRLRTLGRFAEVCTLPLLGVFALFLPLSLETVDPAELWPLREEALRAAVTDAPRLFGALSAGFYPAFLPGPRADGGRGSGLALPFGGAALLGALLGAATVGSFGSSLAGEMNYPFFVLLRNLRVFHLLDRAEALAIALWAVTDFVLLGTLLQLAAGLLSFARGLAQTGRLAPLLCAAAAVLLGFVCAPTSFALRQLSRTVIPRVHVLLLLTALPYAARNIRRR